VLPILWAKKIKRRILC